MSASQITSSLSPGFFSWSWDWCDYFLAPVLPQTTATENWSYLDVNSHPDLEIYNATVGELATLFRDCSGLRPELLDAFTAISQSSIGFSSLGIHFRGGDMRWAPSHPTPPSAKQVFALVDETLEKHSLDQVLIATVVPGFWQKASRRYGKRVISSESLLSTLGPGVLAVQGSRISVLWDAFALGQTRHMIHSASNVALAAKVLSSDNLRSATRIDSGENPRTLLRSIPEGLVVRPIRNLFKADNSLHEETTRSEWGMF